MKKTASQLRMEAIAERNEMLERNPPKCVSCGKTMVQNGMTCKWECNCDDGVKTTKLMETISEIDFNNGK